MEQEENYLKKELYSSIKKNDSIFEFLQAGSLDGIWYWDLQKPENEWISPQFWEILGYDPTEKKHLSSEWQNLIFPDDLKVSIENFEKHCKDPNHPYDQIVRYKHKNGSTVWIRCRGIAIRDENGKPVRMLGAHNDLTNLKQSEIKLIESEEHFRALFENAPLGYQSLDINGNFIEVNETWCKTLGYEKHEIIGRNFSEFLHPDFREHFQKNFPKFKSMGYILGVEFEMIKKDGSEIIVSFNGKIGHQNDGSFKQTHCILRDITEQKSIEDALKNSENRFRSITENAVDYIFIKDRDRKYTFVNSAMKNLLGLPENEILGKTPEEIFGPKEGNIIKEVDDRAFAGETVNETRELIIGEKKLAFNTLQTSLTVENGMVTSIMGIVRDVTKQKQLEEQLQQSEKMRAIGQLAGGIAHDFNNQLAGIVGYADILRLELSNNPELSYYADNILLTSKRAADLTSQLLAFARKGKYLTIPVDIHMIIVEVVNILHRTIDKRIVIRQLLEAQFPITEGDPTQIQNAVMNIALNARDAMPNGGELIFATTVKPLETEYCVNNPYEIIPGKYIQLCITDNGKGMDEATKSKIFEPFFTTKDQGKGTGMGLASVYGTLKSHGGAINVYSEPDHGTTMKLYFPLVEKGEENNVPMKGEDEAIIGEAHILLVDDEDVVIDTASRMLKNMGYKVSIARNGKEAIEFFKENWKIIDLVILDMVMPKLNGKETNSALKKINPAVLVLLSSGYSINGEAQKILDEGVNGFIQKPYRRVELAQAVNKILKGNRKN